MEFPIPAPVHINHFTKEVLNQNRHAPSLESAIELENRNQSILCITPEFFKAVEKFGQRKKSK